MRKVDLTGQRFGRLVAVHSTTKTSSGKYKWLCKCDCGESLEVIMDNLRTGNTQSCGCFLKDYPSGYIHGMSYTPEHKAWKHMKARCYDPNDPRYSRYGGRGIQVCKRWRVSFEHFFRDMGPRPSPKHSLDRIDTNGHYNPKNCRWATREQQMNNTSRNFNVTWRGKTQSLSMWARELGIQPGTLISRIQVGWTLYRAFTTPVKSKNS